MFTTIVLEIVFDVNRRRDRTHKHSERLNLIFSFKLISYDVAERDAARTRFTRNRKIMIALNDRNTESFHLDKWNLDFFPRNVSA